MGTPALRAEKTVASRSNGVLEWLPNLEPHTMRSYRAGLVAFANWLAAQGFVQADIDEKDAAVAAAGRFLLSLQPGEANQIVERWCLSMLRPAEETGAPPYTRGTVNNRLSAVKWAVREAARMGIVPWTLQVRLPKAVKDAGGRPVLRPGRDMRGPDFDDAVALLRRAREKGDVFGEAIVSLILFETLREHEIRQLNYPADVDLDAGRITVVRKKRVEPELLYLADKTVDVLTRWVRFRGNRKGPMFHRWETRSLQRIGTTRIFTHLRLLGAECGLSRPLSPHRLRHTAITAGDAVAENLGVTAKARQKRSGHANDRAYGRYLDNLHVEAKRVSDAVAALITSD